MVAITFLDESGDGRTIDAAVGRSLMQAATENHVPGILGDCGGWCTCSTCHILVPEEWLSRLAPREEAEAAILDGIGAVSERSRLACQIEVAEDLHGMVVVVPPPAF